MRRLSRSPLLAAAAAGGALAGCEDNASFAPPPPGAPRVQAVTVAPADGGSRGHTRMNSTAPRTSRSRHGPLPLRRLAALALAGATTLGGCGGELHSPLPPPPPPPPEGGTWVLVDSLQTFSAWGTLYDVVVTVPHAPSPAPPGELVGRTHDGHTVTASAHVDSYAHPKVKLGFVRSAPARPCSSRSA